MSLEIQNLHVRTDEREILHGVDLVINKGETHALMGPNGSGKSTLANTLMGNPTYEITEGKILLDGEDITEADPDDRAKAGLFLAFQYPVSIPGVSVANFLRTAINAKREEPIKVKEFGELLKKNMEVLRVEREFTSRYLNDGFSGGEKKRMEILQMALLQPSFCILDETDSGLDIDALRVVADGVNALRSPERSFLVITHYQRLLNHIVPDSVHVMANGRIVRSGGPELALELEANGYAEYSLQAAE
ncbi:MAG: Fe-S cluster assembly ATPase SufC [Microvirga sp.]